MGEQLEPVRTLDQGNRSSQAAVEEAYSDPDYYRQVLSEQNNGNNGSNALHDMEIVDEQGDAGEDNGDKNKPLPPSQRPISDIPPELQQLADQYGLSVDRVEFNGTTTYAFGVVGPDGEVEIIANGTDEDTLRQTFIDERAARVGRLEDQYNLDILDTGERTNGGDLARAPNFAELTTLEYALEQSGPSARDEDDLSDIPYIGPALEALDNDELVIAYAQSDTSEHAAAYYSHSHGDSRAQIVFDPGYGDNANVAIHELAHNGQYGYWNADNPESERYQEYLERLGWVRTEDGTELIMTDDQPPQYFDQIEREGANGKGQEKFFLRTDREGNYLDAEGNRVDNPDEAQRIEPDEMARRAKVKPATGYIDTPREYGAEMMTVLRTSEDTRAMLLREHADTYYLARDLDQQEINDQYGVDEDGQPNKIRLETGEIVDNTEANRRHLADWEEQVLSTPADPDKEGKLREALEAIHKGVVKGTEAGLPEGNQPGSERPQTQPPPQPVPPDNQLSGPG